jgi:hypothetical protein
MLIMSITHERLRALRGHGIPGDYAKTAAMDTFSATRQPRHLTEIAMPNGGAS